MVQRDPNDLRVRLTTVTDRSWQLNHTLEISILHKDSQVTENLRSVAVEASPPWNARVAYLIMDLHTMARQVERDLLAGLSGHQRSRGGSSANTEHALKSVSRLAESVPDDVVIDILRWLDNWNTRAELVLGYVDPIAHVPATPEGAEPRCPWCDYLTLRIKRATATAYCVNPGCQYSPSDQRRPRGRVETDVLTGEIMIYWHGELPVQEEEEAA